MTTRPASSCKAKSRRKVKKRPLGMRAPPRSGCRYASIWQCGGDGDHTRRLANTAR